MIDWLQKYERITVTALLVMLMVTVLVATVELGWILLRDVLRPPFDILNVGELLEVFGFFLMVLLGLELLEMMKVYLNESEIHVEVVLLVALVAVGRKIVIIDYSNVSHEQLFGMAALVLALSAGYFFLKKSPLRKPGQLKERNSKEDPT